MLGDISNETKRANGFSPAYIYYTNVEDRRLVKGYCMEHRLWIMKESSDLIGLLYADSLEKKCDTLVVSSLSVLGEGDEGIFNRYILGTRGFLNIRPVDGVIDDKEEMISVFVRKEREYRTNKVWNIKKKAIDDGKYCGGRLPYGYYAMSKQLFVDKYESFIVKFIFYRLSQGCSEYGIMKELNLRGFHNRAGKPFMTGSIHSIVQRKRFYQGYLRTYDGGEVKGNFTPLIDEDGLVSKDYIKRHFDEETEKRIAQSRRLAKQSTEFHYHVAPYMLEKERGGIKRGRTPQYEKPV